MNTKPNESIEYFTNDLNYDSDQMFFDTTFTNQMQLNLSNKNAGRKNNNLSSASHYAFEEKEKPPLAINRNQNTVSLPSIKNKNYKSPYG